MMMTREELLQRFIPFDGLRYSTDAFIDYRIPGCAPKKNFALIGPGVSQNPNQPVSLRERHGFQVGGVSMPAGTINPPHMHFTAEVFICTKGRWEMHWGFDPATHKAEVSEGDIFSVPTWIYRGFQSLGPQDAFMFTALGRDDTGGILWGPWTLDAARNEGVHLTEDYRIIDEQLGQKWTDSDKRLQPMSVQDIASLRKWTPPAMEKRAVRFADLDWSREALLDSRLPGCGTELAPVIGFGMSQDRNHLAPVMNAHGFSIEWLLLPPGAGVSRHHLVDKQVLVVYRGEVEIIAEGTDAPALFQAKGSIEGWDSYAMPAHVWRSYRNNTSKEAVMLVMTPGDHCKRIVWSDEVVQAAAKANRAIDANGFVAPKNFVDRSQR